MVFRNHGVHGGLYPAAITSAPALGLTPSFASAARRSLSFSAMSAARMFPLNVATATVLEGTSFIVTFGSVGVGASAALAKRLAGRKNAILYDPSSLALFISTGAVIAMGAACSFLGLAMTPMKPASRMNEFPWSPSNMPFVDWNPVSATTQGA